MANKNGSFITINASSSDELIRALKQYNQGLFNDEDLLKRFLGVGASDKEINILGKKSKSERDSIEKAIKNSPKFDNELRKLENNLKNAGLCISKYDIDSKTNTLVMTINPDERSQAGLLIKKNWEKGVQNFKKDLNIKVELPDYMGVTTHNKQMSVPALIGGFWGEKDDHKGGYLTQGYVESIKALNEYFTGANKAASKLMNNIKKGNIASIQGSINSRIENIVQTSSTVGSSEGMKAYNESKAQMALDNKVSEATFLQIIQKASRMNLTPAIKKMAYQMAVQFKDKIGVDGNRNDFRGFQADIEKQIFNLMLERSKGAAWGAILKQAKKDEKLGFLINDKTKNSFKSLDMFTKMGLTMNNISESSYEQMIVSFIGEGINGVDSTGGSRLSQQIANLRPLQNKKSRPLSHGRANYGKSYDKAVMAIAKEDAGKAQEILDSVDQRTYNYAYVSPETLKKAWEYYYKQTFGTKKRNEIKNKEWKKFVKTYGNGTLSVGNGAALINPQIMKEHNSYDPINKSVLKKELEEAAVKRYRREQFEMLKKRKIDANFTKENLKEERKKIQDLSSQDIRNTFTNEDAFYTFGAAEHFKLKKSDPVSVEKNELYDDALTVIGKKGLTLNDVTKVVGTGEIERSTVAPFSEALVLKALELEGYTSEQIKQITKKDGSLDLGFVIGRQGKRDARNTPRISQGKYEFYNGLVLERATPDKRKKFIEKIKNDPVWSAIADFNEKTNHFSGFDTFSVNDKPLTVQDINRLGSFYEEALGIENPFKLKTSYKTDKDGNFLLDDKGDKIIDEIKLDDTFAFGRGTSGIANVGHYGDATKNGGKNFSLDYRAKDAINRAIDKDSILNKEVFSKFFTSSGKNTLQEYADYINNLEETMNNSATGRKVDPSKIIKMSDFLNELNKANPDGYNPRLIMEKDAHSGQISQENFDKSPLGILTKFQEQYGSDIYLDPETENGWTGSSAYGDTKIQGKLIPLGQLLRGSRLHGIEKKNGYVSDISDADRIFSNMISDIVTMDPETETVEDILNGTNSDYLYGQTLGVGSMIDAIWQDSHAADGSIYSNAHKIKIGHSMSGQATGMEPSIISPSYDAYHNGGIFIGQDQAAAMLDRQGNTSNKDYIEKLKSIYSELYKGENKPFKDLDKMSKKKKIETLKKGILEAINPESDNFTNVGLKGIFGRFPFSNGRDVKAARIFINSAFNGSTRMGGNQGLLSTVNADFDGDHLYLSLLDMMDQVGKLNVKDRKQYTEDFNKFQKETNRVSQIVSAATASSSSLESNFLSQKEINNLRDKNAHGKADVAAKVNKSFTGSLSNMYQSIANAMTYFGLDETRSIENQKDAEIAIGAMLTRGIFEVPTQEAISAKKIINKFLTSKNIVASQDDQNKITSWDDLNEKEQQALLNKLGYLDAVKDFTSLVRSINKFTDKDILKIITNMQDLGWLEKDKGIFTGRIGGQLLGYIEQLKTKDGEEIGRKILESDDLFGKKAKLIQWDKSKGYEVLKSLTESEVLNTLGMDKNNLSTEEEEYLKGIFGQDSNGNINYHDLSSQDIVSLFQWTPEKVARLAGKTSAAGNKIDYGTTNPETGRYIYSRLGTKGLYASVLAQNRATIVGKKSSMINAAINEISKNTNLNSIGQESEGKAISKKIEARLANSAEVIKKVLKEGNNSPEDRSSGGAGFDSLGLLFGGQNSYGRIYEELHNEAIKSLDSFELNEDPKKFGSITSLTSLLFPNTGSYPYNREFNEWLDNAYIQFKKSGKQNQITYEDLIGSEESPFKQQEIDQFAKYGFYSRTGTYIHTLAQARAKIAEYNNKKGRKEKSKVAIPENFEDLEKIMSELPTKTAKSEFQKWYYGTADEKGVRETLEKIQYIERLTLDQGEFKKWEDTVSRRAKGQSDFLKNYKILGEELGVIGNIGGMRQGFIDVLGLTTEKLYDGNKTYLDVIDIKPGEKMTTKQMFQAMAYKEMLEQTRDHLKKKNYSKDNAGYDKFKEDSGEKSNNLFLKNLTKLNNGRIFSKDIYDALLDDKVIIRSIVNNMDYNTGAGNSNVLPTSFYAGTTSSRYKQALSQMMTAAVFNVPVNTVAESFHNNPLEDIKNSYNSTQQTLKEGSLTEFSKANDEYLKLKGKLGTLNNRYDNELRKNSEGADNLNTVLSLKQEILEVTIETAKAEEELLKVEEKIVDPTLKQKVEKEKIDGQNALVINDVQEKDLYNKKDIREKEKQYKELSKEELEYLTQRKNIENQIKVNNGKNERFDIVAKESLQDIDELLDSILKKKQELEAETYQKEYIEIGEDGKIYKSSKTKSYLSEEFKKETADGQQKELDRLQRKYDLQNAKLTPTEKAKNFFTGIGNQLSSVLGYRFFSAYAIIGKLTKGFQTVIQQAQQMNKALVDLQVVTGGTTEETINLLTNYNKLGSELGATTTEVAQAANAWLRQGYQAQEVTDLVTASLYLSKLGMLSSADATTNLTSALKGFKLEAADALSVVDKLTAVDMSAAVSAGDIATALSGFATTAQLSGVNMDQAIAMAATIADVSQAGASSVGAALKTILSRYGNVKAGSFVSLENEDNEDVSINDVEKVLATIGISLRSGTNDMRDFGDVLEDVSDKWNTLDKVSKNALATAFAGVRQREAFLVLMENMDKYHDLIDVSENSAGTATKKYLSYSQQLEASQKKLVAAWEGLVNNSDLQKFMKMLTDFTTSLVKALPVILKFSVRFGTMIASPRIVKMLASAGQTMGVFAKGLFSKDGFSRAASTALRISGLGGNTDNVVRSSLKNIEKDVSSLAANINNSKNSNSSARGKLPTLEELDSGYTEGESYKISPTGEVFSSSMSIKDIQKQQLQNINSKYKEYKQKYKIVDGKVVDKKSNVLNPESQEEVMSILRPREYLSRVKADEIEKSRKNLSGKVFDGKQWYSKENGKFSQLSKEEAIQLNKDKANLENYSNALRKQAARAKTATSVMTGVQIGTQMVSGGVAGYLTAPESTTIKDSQGNEIQVALNGKEKTYSQTASTIAGAIPLIGPIVSAFVDRGIKNDTFGLFSKSRNIAKAEQNAAERSSTLSSVASDISTFKTQVENGELLSGKETLNTILNTLYKTENKAGRLQFEKYVKQALGVTGSKSLLDICQDMNGNLEAQKQLSQAMLIAQKKAERDNLIDSNTKELSEIADQEDAAYAKYRDGDYDKKIRQAKVGGGIGGAFLGANVGGVAGLGAGTATAGIMTLLGVEMSVPIVGGIAAAITAIGFGIVGAIIGIKEAEEKKKEQLAEQNRQDTMSLGDKIQEVQDSIDNSNDPEEREKLTQILETLKDANGQLYSINKQLDKNQVEQALLSAHNDQNEYITNLSKYRLKQLGTDEIEKLIAAELVANGGLNNASVYLDDNETLTNYAKSLIESSLSDYSNLKSVFSGEAYTLREALDRKDQKLLNNFALALHTSVENLENFAKELGDLELGDFMLSVNDACEKIKTYTEAMKTLTDSSTTQVDKQELIIKQFPELIQYLGDNNKLLSELRKKIRELSQATTDKIVGQIFSSEEYYGESLQTGVNEIALGYKNSKGIDDEVYNLITKAESVDKLLTILSQIDNDDLVKEIQEYVKNNMQDISVIVDLERENINAALAYRSHLIEEELTNLNDQKQALEEINSKREYENKLIEARLKLENAQNEKKRVWREGVGWTYEADQNAIKEAQDEIDSLDNQKLISQLELQIQELESDKQALSDWSEDKKWEEQKALYENYFGSGDKSVLSLLANADTTLTEFKSLVSGSLEEYFNSKKNQANDYVNGVGDAKGLEELSKYFEEKAKENWHTNEQGVLVKTDKDGNEVAVTDKEKNEYNSNLQRYNELRDQAISSGIMTSEGDIVTTDNEGKSQSHNYGEITAHGGQEYSVADSFVVDGMTKLTSGLDTINTNQKEYVWGDIKNKTGVGYFPNGDKIYFKKGKAYLDPNYKQEATSYSTEKYSTIEDYAKQFPNAILAGTFKNNEYAYIKNSLIYGMGKQSYPWGSFDYYKGARFLSGNTNNGWYTYPEDGKMPAYAVGTLSAHGGTSLINELGTEAIITPAGTLTSLPSATGIIPADITKNLWQLGELAPSILNSLGESIFSYGRNFSHQNSNVDNSFNVNNINMTVQADDSFDPDKWVSAIKAQAALSRNNR